MPASFGASGMKYPRAHHWLWNAFDWDWRWAIWNNQAHVCLKCGPKVLPPQLWITQSTYPQAKP